MGYCLVRGRAFQRGLFRRDGFDFQNQPPSVNRSRHSSHSSMFVSVPSLNSTLVGSPGFSSHSTQVIECHGSPPCIALPGIYPANNTTTVGGSGPTRGFLS